MILGLDGGAEELLNGKVNLTEDKLTHAFIAVPEARTALAHALSTSN